jgi:hypothetical protein
MSKCEKTNERDGSPSAWHREDSIKRYTKTGEQARLLTQIDVDAALFTEYEDGTKEPVGLIEYAQDVGQDHKSATVLQRLAARSNPELEAWVVLYTPACTANPADPKWRDIMSFRAQQLCPRPKTKNWRVMTPRQYTALLLEIRERAANRRAPRLVAPEFFYLPD